MLELFQNSKELWFLQQIIFQSIANKSVFEKVFILKKTIYYFLANLKGHILTLAVFQKTIVHCLLFFSATKLLERTFSSAQAQENLLFSYRHLLEVFFNQFDLIPLEIRHSSGQARAGKSTIALINKSNQPLRS